MIDRFEELLHELGVEVGLTLHSDKIGACTLKIADAPDLHLECGKHLGTLLIASFICEIPPGKVRENILKDALKANEISIEHGILGFSERNNQLALFSLLSMEGLNGKSLFHALNLFIDKAIQWNSSIAAGTTSSLSSSSSTENKNKIFGL